MTNDLLPCPFCGGGAFYNFTDAGADRKYYRVHCSKCDARIGHPYTGKDAAATAWNTRTPNKPAEVDLDAMTPLDALNNLWACQGPNTVPDAVYFKIKDALSSHLATGKGGGNDWVKAHLDEAKADYETWPEWRKEVSRSADQQKTAEPCRDDKPAAYWARYNDGSGKIYEDKDRAEAYAERANLKCTVIPVYTKPQPAAPTQIDAGDLEEALRRYANGTLMFDSEYFDAIIKVARAHLSKLSGGDAPQSDTVAVPREALVKAARVLKVYADGRETALTSLTADSAHLALQPYTKGDGD